MPELSGIETLMQEFDSKVLADTPPPTPEVKPETPPTPEVKPETPPAKPEEKAPEVKPEAKPEVKPAAKKEVGDDEIEKERKANPNHKAWKILDSVKAKFATTEAAWKAEKAALESRPQSNANDARIAQLEKLLGERDGELKSWKQRTEEADFTRSETYTSQFVKPYQAELKRAFDEVKNLTITFVKDNENQTRQATELDFRKAMSLPPDEQDAFIHEAFGRSAWRVINRINELNRIRSASEEAVREFSENYEKNKTERELAQQREQDEYKRDFEAEHDRLRKDAEFGKYVSESDADPEGTQLLKTELEKFDGYKEAMQKMSAKDRAAVAALVRARFAGAPRLQSEVKRQASKIAELEAELGKFRKADPGAKPGGKGAPAPKETGGIADMAAAFDKV